MNDHIVTSIDKVSYNLVLKVFQELNAAGCLQVTHQQSFNIHGLMGINPAQNIFQREMDFCKTMSTTMRLAVLYCGRVPEVIWRKHMGADHYRDIIRNRWGVAPNPGVISQLNNGQGQPMPMYQLAVDQQTAQYYWSSFDHLYPAFYIKNKLPPVPVPAATLNGQLFIFDQNLTRVIEINTNLIIRRPRATAYDVRLSVVLTVRNITQAAEDGDWMRLFRYLLTDHQGPAAVADTDDEEGDDDEGGEDDEEGGDDEGDEDAANQEMNELASRLAGKLQIKKQ